MSNDPEVDKQVYQIKVHGILAKIRNLNLTLISVSRVETNSNDEV